MKKQKVTKKTKKSVPFFSQLFLFLRKLKVAFLFFFIIGIIIDIFFIPGTSDFRLFLLLILWIVVLYLYQFTSKATVILLFILLVPFSLQYLLNPSHPRIERMGTWIYLFMWIAVAQQFLEVVRNAKK